MVTQTPFGYIERDLNRSAIEAARLSEEVERINNVFDYLQDHPLNLGVWPDLKMSQEKGD